MKNKNLRVTISNLLKNKKVSKKDKEDLLLKLIHLTIVKARKDFYVFLKLMAPRVLPDKFKDGRHLKLLTKILMETEKSVRGGKRKVQPIISLPPRIYEISLYFSDVP